MNKYLLLMLHSVNFIFMTSSVSSICNMGAMGLRGQMIQQYESECRQDIENRKECERQKVSDVDECVRRKRQ